MKQVMRLFFLCLMGTILLSTVSCAGRSSIAPQGKDSLVPISQGTVAGRFVFVSGQVPYNRETKQMAVGIVDQTRQAMENVKAVLEAAGSSFDDTVKITIYMRDISQFPQAVAVYKTFFTKDYPAATCVEVSGLLGGSALEIEAIGLVR